MQFCDIKNINKRLFESLTLADTDGQQSWIAKITIASLVAASWCRKWE